MKKLNGTILVLASSVFSGLALFFLYKLILTAYGSDVQMLFVSVVMLSGILAAVFDVGMSKLISRLVAQPDQDSVLFVRTIITLYLCSGMIGIAVSLIFGNQILQFWLGDVIVNTVLLSQSAKYFFVACFFSIFQLAFQAIAVGSGQIHRQVALNLLGGVVIYSPLCIYSTFGGNFDDLGKLYLGLRCAVLLASVLIFSRGEFLLFYKPNFYVNRAYHFWPSVRRVSLAAGINTMIKSSDRILLSFLAPKEFFVFYEVFNQMLNRASLPLNSFINVYYKSWVRRLTKSGKENISLLALDLKNSLKIWITCAAVVLPFVLIFAMLFIVSRPLIFEEVLLAILAGPTFFCISRARIYGILFLAKAEEKGYLKNSLCVAIVAVFMIILAVIIDYRVLVFYGFLSSLIGVLVFKRDIKLIDR